MEAVVLILLGGLVIVSLLANAFKRDGDDVRASLVKADARIRQLEAQVSVLQQELAEMPTEQQIINRIAAARAMRVAQRAATQLRKEHDEFVKRNTR